jgi:predicted DsbA family dithiol-disulfide isomerase
MTPLHIDFVSDVACPWCAIGLAGLEEALRRASPAVQARISFQPFELNPGMSAEGQNLDEHIGGKYGGTPQQLEANRQALRERAAAVGFEFNSSSRSRVYNTFNAHRLLHWAGTVDNTLQHALKRALFRANFTDDARISDPEVLARVAESSGLDGQQARSVLASDRYAREVREAEMLWHSRGIHAVPGMVINGKWLISGGQPPEIIEQALRKIASGS